MEQKESITNAFLCQKNKKDRGTEPEFRKEINTSRYITNSSVQRDSYKYVIVLKESAFLPVFISNKALSG